MRYTDDKRLLIREDIGYCPSLRMSEAERQKTARRHKTLFDQRYPMLPNVEMAHTWTVLCP